MIRKQGQGQPATQRHPSSSRKDVAMSDRSNTTPPGDEHPSKGEILDAIAEAVASKIEWPLWDQFLPIFYNAVADGTYTIPPPKSHLSLWKDGAWVKGATVVALGSRDDHGRVMTERGDWVRLDENCVLVVGR